MTVGCASLTPESGIAWLGGAATVPSGRRRGVQGALVRHRMAVAADVGLRPRCRHRDAGRRLGPQPRPARLHARLLPGRADQGAGVNLRLRPLRVDDEAAFDAAQAELARRRLPVRLPRDPASRSPTTCRPRSTTRAAATCPPGSSRARSSSPRSAGRSSAARPSATSSTTSCAREGGHIGYAVRPAHRRRGYATEILRQSLIIARADRRRPRARDVRRRQRGVGGGDRGVRRRARGGRAGERGARRRGHPALLDRLMAREPSRPSCCSSPPPVSVAVDEIRMRWDPVMCARIGAHITLVHDVVDHDRARHLVAATAASTAPFTVTPDRHRPLGTCGARGVPARRRPERWDRRAARAPGRARGAALGAGRVPCPLHARAQPHDGGDGGRPGVGRARRASTPAGTSRSRRSTSSRWTRPPAGAASSSSRCTAERSSPTDLAADRSAGRRELAGWRRQIDGRMGDDR